MHALITKENNAKQLSGSGTGQGIMKSRSPVRINMLTLVNDLWAAQFVTINVDGTVTSNNNNNNNKQICIARSGRNFTRVVISRPIVGSSRFHNFCVSSLYRAYVTTCCHVGSVELWNVHYSRYIDTLVQLSVGTWIPRDVACVF